MDERDQNNFYEHTGFPGVEKLEDRSYFQSPTANIEEVEPKSNQCFGDFSSWLQTVAKDNSPKEIYEEPIKQLEKKVAS